MIISVASGKGGTGKTTVSVNLALSLDNAQILDCDVEEPNVQIFIKPEIERTLAVKVPVPEVDLNVCNFCGKCSQVCNYNAICVIPPRQNFKGNVLIFDHLCHSCGACWYFCPQKAIMEKEKVIAYVDVGKRGDLKYVGGRLLPSQVLSPVVIDEVKRHMDKDRVAIIDASPGTACPVVRAISGSDFCILVTEPTPFGLNDLNLAYQLTHLLKVPSGIVLNRADYGDKTLIKEFAKKNDIPLLLEIPFDNKIAQTYSEGIPVVEAIPEYREIFKELYEKISEIIR